MCLVRVKILTGPYAAVIPLFIQSASEKKPASINGDGEISRDFTFIENTVQANIKALFALLRSSRSGERGLRRSNKFK